MTDREPGAAAIAEKYLVGCPDVVEITVAGRPDLSFHSVVGADGRVDLGPLGRPRVEGRAVPQISQVVAEQAGVVPDLVGTQVVEFNSQEVYLFGQVSGMQRSIPYRGQETVLALLQRVGGITPGAAPDEVFVVRPHVAEGQRPEVFHVDLQAIVMRHDDSTNLRLQPFDQVHVGETRQARVERCIPPWVRPLYRFICDTQHPPEKRAELAAERQQRRERRRTGPEQPPATPPPPQPLQVPESLPQPRPLRP